MQLSPYKKAYFFQIFLTVYLFLPFVIGVTLSENDIQLDNQWLILLGVLWVLGFVGLNLLRLYLFNCPKCGLNIFNNYTPHLLFNIPHNFPYKICTKCAYDHTKV